MATGRRVVVSGAVPGYRSGLARGVAPKRRGAVWAAAGQRMHLLGGFTLLEVLVAITILALLIMAGFGGLRVGSRSWEAGLEHSGQTDATRSLRSFLGRQFGRVVAIRIKEGEGARLAFEGTSEKVTYVVPAPAYSVSGLQAITLGKESDGRTMRLVARVSDFNPGRAEVGAQPGEDEAVLVDGAASIMLSYFGSTRVGRPPLWLRNWPETAEFLPRLVRIQVVPQSERSEPLDLLFPIIVQGRA